MTNGKGSNMDQRMHDKGIGLGGQMDTPHMPSPGAISPMQHFHNAEKGDPQESHIHIREQSQ